MSTVSPKETILRKSSRLFKKKGYSNTSIAMLAEECNMVKSHFYYYFSSKEELMEEVLKRELNLFVNDVFFVAYEEAYGAKKRLRKLLKNLEEQFFKSKSGNSLMAITAFQAPKEESKTFFPIIREFYTEWENALSSIYNLKFDKKESERKALRAILMIDGVIMNMKFKKDKSVYKRIVTLLEEELNSKPTR